MKGQLPGQSEMLSIEERNKRIIRLLGIQRKEIQINLKKQFQIFLRKSEKSLSRSYTTQQCYEDLSYYLRASFNLLNVYFPLLSSQEFISLQTQKEIFNRVEDLKTSIFRSFKSLCGKLPSRHEEKQKESPKKKSNQSNFKKSSNTKIPTENSLILTEWLLRNFNNPYPSIEQKQKLAEESSLSVSQVNNWFINSRERVIKRYLKKESKEDGGKERKNFHKQ